MEQFNLLENVPLRYLLNEKKKLFLSWHRSAIEELDDWALPVKIFFVTAR